MENQTRQLADAAKIAQFRLAIIAPVIHGLYPDASKNAYYRRITEKPLTLPDGSTFQYNPKTISKWVSLYQSGGIDALMPRERSDKGSTRVLPDTAIAEIYRLKDAFPRLNATQIHRQLVEDSFIPATVNVCAVQRFIRNHDLKSARNPNMKDRKAFSEGPEAGRFCLWDSNEALCGLYRYFYYSEVLRCGLKIKPKSVEISE